MNNFWTELPRPFFVLAPMEAVTDVVFRHVVAAAAPPDVYFTEFTNATGWAHAGDKAIGGRLIKTDDENPIVAQLWGSVPGDMEKLAVHCAQIGYDGIDINMGCPDASAVKSGGGSGMILNPENAAAIIASAKKSGLPVSVKTRLGYSRIDEWMDWLTHILNQDIVNLTIHLRTRKEMSKVPAHFELIADIKKLRDEIAPGTLLTINGDIEDHAQGMELVEKYGVDGIMIGRGIFHNPFAFAQTQQGQEPGEQQLLNLLRFQLDLHDHYDSQMPRKFDPLKRFFKIYVRDFTGAAELRDQLMHAKSTSEVREILDQTDLDINQTRQTAEAA
ncbi:MAG: tRNA-dihydrouridine synthase [Candidatus Saccharibacteria bacterium]|nr:tRNA-dihydrouridine synthase [Candidatus Saccharibacteria bacterium]